MSNVLIRKLEMANRLVDDDRDVLMRLCTETHFVEAKKDLTQEGDRPENVYLIVDGFACRYKLLPSGERHIIALLVSGDFCDLHVAILGEMDHSIATISPCTMVIIPRATIDDLTLNQPRVSRALWWATLVDEGVLREWLVNIGHRPANKRLAHFFCEMLIRLQTVGLADETSYFLPLTQTDLADIFGLTTVHVNRTLTELRGQQLVLFKSRRLTIPDPTRLMEYCDFNPNYLHLKSRYGETNH